MLWRKNFRVCYRFLKQHTSDYRILLWQLLKFYTFIYSNIVLNTPFKEHLISSPPLPKKPPQLITWVYVFLHIIGALSNWFPLQILCMLIYRMLFLCGYYPFPACTTHWAPCTPDHVFCVFHEFLIYGKSRLYFQHTH